MDRCWEAGNGLKPEMEAKIHCVLATVLSPDVCGQTASKAGLGDVCRSAGRTPDNAKLLDGNSSWWAVILSRFLLFVQRKCEKLALN